MIQDPNEKKTKEDVLPEAKFPSYLAQYAQQQGFGKIATELESSLKTARENKNKGLFYFLLHTLHSLNYTVKLGDGGEKDKVLAKLILSSMNNIAIKSNARFAQNPQDVWISEDEASIAVSFVRKLMEKTLGPADWTVVGGVKKKGLDKLPAHGKTSTCPDCRGTGKKDGKKEEGTPACPTCFGKGRLEKEDSKIHMTWTRSVQGYVNEVVDASLEALSLSHAFPLISPSENVAQRLLDTVVRELPAGVRDWSKAEMSPDMLDVGTVYSYSPNEIAKDLMAWNRDVKSKADRIAKRINLASNAERVRTSNNLLDTSENLDQQLYILGFNIVFKVVEIAGIFNLSARLNVSTQVSEMLLSKLRTTTSQEGQVQSTPESQNLVSSVPALKKLGFYNTELMEQIQNALKNEVSSLFEQDTLYKMATSIFSAMFAHETRSKKTSAEKGKKKIEGDEVRSEKESEKFALKYKGEENQDEFDTEEKIPGAYTTAVKDLSPKDKEELKSGKLKADSLSEAKTAKKPDSTLSPEEESENAKKKEERAKNIAEREKAAVMFKATLGIRPLLARVLKGVSTSGTIPGEVSDVEGAEKLETFYMDSILYSLTGNRKVSDYAPGGVSEGGFRNLITDEIAKHWIYKLGLTYSAGLGFVLGKDEKKLPTFYERVYTPATRMKLVKASNREVVNAVSTRLELFAFRKILVERLPLLIQQNILESQKTVLGGTMRISQMFAAMVNKTKAYSLAGTPQDKAETGAALLDLVSRIFGSGGTKGILELEQEKLAVSMTKIRGMESFNVKVYSDFIKSVSFAVENREEGNPADAKEEVEGLLLGRNVDYLAASINEALNSSGIRARAANLIMRYSSLNVVLGNMMRALPNKSSEPTYVVTDEKKAKELLKKNPAAILAGQEGSGVEAAPNKNLTTADNVAEFVLEQAPLVFKELGSGPEKPETTTFSKPIAEIMQRAKTLKIQEARETESPTYEVWVIFVQVISTILGEVSRTGSDKKKSVEFESFKKQLRALLEGEGKTWVDAVIDSAKNLAPNERIKKFEIESWRVIKKIYAMKEGMLKKTDLEKPIGAETEFDPAKNFAEYVQNDIMFQGNDEEGGSEGEVKEEEAKAKGPASKVPSYQQKKKAEEKRNAGLNMNRDARFELVDAMKRVVSERKAFIEIHNELMDGIIKTHPDLFPEDERKDYLRGTKKVLWKGQLITLWDLSDIIAGKVIDDLSESTKVYNPTEQKTEKTEAENG